MDMQATERTPDIISVRRDADGRLALVDAHGAVYVLEARHDAFLRRPRLELRPTIAAPPLDW